MFAIFLFHVKKGMDYDDHRHQHYMYLTRDSNMFHMYKFLC